MIFLTNLCDSYASEWLNRGAYEIHFNTCATGYIQSFAIRTLCAGYKLIKKEEYRLAAKRWADLTLRLQGTQGIPDGYNMGYHNTIRADGTPKAWYPADCGDIALAVLDTASILEKSDPFRKKLIDSVIHYTDYVLDYWSNEDGSVGGFIEEFEEHHYNFWCADSRMCNVLWGLTKMGYDQYHERAVTLTHHSATIDQNRHNHKGEKICEYNYSLAVYMPDAICNGLQHLSEEYAEIKQECIAHLQDRFFHWASANQLNNGTWQKKKSGLEEESVGGYHGCLLANLMLAKPYLEEIAEWHDISSKALAIAQQAAESEETVESDHKWGVNSTLGLGIAAALNPISIFPSR